MMDCDDPTAYLDDLSDALFARLKAEIDAFLERYPAAEWGPAHAVLSDLNLDGYFIVGAIAGTLDPRATGDPAMLAATRDLLLALLAQLP